MTLALRLVSLTLLLVCSLGITSQVHSASFEEISALLGKAGEVANEPKPSPAAVTVQTAPADPNHGLPNIYLKMIAERGEKELATSPDLPEWVKQRIRERFDLDPVTAKARQDSQSTPLYKVRHILLKTKFAASQIIVGLRDGRDFTSLANRYSKAKNDGPGGALGWRELGSFQEHTRNIIRNLGKGEFSQTLVQDKFGWHVFLLEDTKGVRPEKSSAVSTTSSKQELQKTSKITGDEYEGETHRGKRDGQGTYRWQDGRQFIGEFLAGQFINGIYMMPNGFTYIGTVSINDPKLFSMKTIKGTGELRFPDGSRYVHHFGYPEHAGALVDVNGDAVMGVLNLSHQTPTFNVLSVEELKGFKVAYGFVAKYDVLSIKQLDESTFHKIREEQVALAIEAEKILKKYEMEICQEHKDETLERLKRKAEFVNAMECGETSSWDEINTLQKHVDVLEETNQVNEQNLGNTGFWIKHLRHCIRRLSSQVGYPGGGKDKLQAASYEPADTYCQDSESISYIQELYDAIDEYNSYGRVELQNAADYADQRESGGYAQMRASDEAHRARMNADFQRWSNNLRSSTQRTLDQMNSPASSYNRRTSTSPDIRQAAEGKYKQDKAIRDQNKVIQKQKEDEAKREREREIEREIAQYKLEQKWRQEDAERQAKQRADDREQECMRVLANDPNSCGCAEFQPKRNRSSCNK